VSIFANKIVFITGAGSGIGFAIANELGARGSVIIATDRDGSAAEACAAGIIARGGRAESITLDVTDNDAVKRAVNETARTHGCLDYIFNNAGVGFAGEVRDSTVEQWRQVLDVNLNGVIYGVMAAYPLMVKQGSGHIVNTASLSGLVVSPTMAPYSASKHAVVGLSRALRAEGEALGVKVTALCPSFVESKVYENSIRAAMGDTPVRSIVPFPILPIEIAVQGLIAGVERNDDLVVLPFQGRVLWWLMRIAPSLVNAKLGQSLANFRRKARVGPPGA
jgi:NAD(P)-dependent dehydrogenase (short-subunit alcohol dehydrogenase family)